MTVNISFSTDYMSSEEADGVSAFIGAVRPSLLTADALRRRVDAQYGPFGGQVASLAGSTALTPTAEAPAPTPPVEPAKTTRSRKPKPEEVAAAADAKPAISTDPENRIDPQNPEDEAQDAADEAAETASEQGEPDHHHRGREGRHRQVRRQVPASGHAGRRAGHLQVGAGRSACRRAVLEAVDPAAGPGQPRQVREGLARRGWAS